MAPCGPGRHPALAAAAAFLAQLLCHGHTGRLYSSQEPVNILEADGVKDLLGNWSGAWVVEFYWSWGGPCVNYGATWKVLGPGGERMQNFSHQKLFALKNIQQEDDYGALSKNVSWVTQD
ncbi:sulfhydryl oxidase 2-like [Hemiscyllium ocellatum]|uniref:sulfhydryl oxidase 2-like n=1 Tax=Hemiscyllium ocellatum TaxID=170820 RepID=UPI0029676D70|nr:sulfhydryl oxidase 2-like [Hemiscyllium ocellatum]